mgnify:CR=1 FL=1
MLEENVKSVVLGTAALVIGFGSSLHSQYKDILKTHDHYAQNLYVCTPLLDDRYGLSKQDASILGKLFIRHGGSYAKWTSFSRDFADPISPRRFKENLAANMFGLDGKVLDNVQAECYEIFNGKVSRQASYASKR